MNLRNFLLSIASASLLSACGAPTATAPVSGAPGTADAFNARSYKIYVANIGNNTITTYEADGTQTTPTIHTGNGPSDYLFGAAVGPSGKIYALNFDPLLGPGTSGTVTTYKPDGTQTTPTIMIRERGYFAPVGLAVDKNGKIYVVSSVHNGSPGVVTTFKPDGRRTTPTFAAGPDSSSVTVDSRGKIYVTNDAGPPGKSSVTTYLRDGARTTPTITREVRQPIGVAIAADGSIFVADTTNNGRDGTGAGYVTSYTADGGGPLERIKNGAGGLGGIAIDASGRLFVASSTAYSSLVKTYAPSGKRTTPTITAGVYEPSGIVLH